MALPRAGKHFTALLGAGAAATALSLPLPALADKKDEPRGPIFDPEALERGAAALREINKSAHAKQVRQHAPTPHHTYTAVTSSRMQADAASPDAPPAAPAAAPHEPPAGLSVPPPAPRR